jgi:hypothetical protein
METIENYLNIIYFCFYKAHYKSHLLSKKINPFNLIHQLPFQKKRYEKLGIDIQKEIDTAFGDMSFGLSTMVAGGMLLGIVGVFFFCILIVFNLIVYATMFHTIACSLLSGILCYFFVFKKDKYKKHFNEYEKWTKFEKRKYCWLSFASIIVVFLLFYLGLIT